MIDGDIVGIIHRHSLLLRGVRVLALFVVFVFGFEAAVIKWLRFSQRAVHTYYFIPIFNETKITLL